MLVEFNVGTPIIAISFSFEAELSRRDLSNSIDISSLDRKYFVNLKYINNRSGTFSNKLNTDSRYSYSLKIIGF